MLAPALYLWEAIGANSDGTTQRLQMLVNAAAQVISSRSRFDSITD
jgi:hypothetical protein